MTADDWAKLDAHPSVTIAASGSWLDAEVADVDSDGWAGR